MRRPVIATVLLSLASLPACAQGAPQRSQLSEAQTTVAPQSPNRPSGPVQQRLVPGMAAYTDEVLFGDVWLRPDLKPRDRSLVTISVLIATGKTAQLEGHLGRALGNGVSGVEASGVLTHLAIYSGWPSAVSALEIYDRVFTARSVDLSTITAPSPALPSLPSDAARKSKAEAELGAFAPKFTEITNDVVFADLWRRSDLSVRDRSLVTIAALAGMGETDLLSDYLKLGTENGLQKSEIVEALTHIGFYAGWPRATKALMIAKAAIGS